MNVEKLMTKEVRTCRPEDNLTVPARIMWEGDFGSVPVVDGEERVIAMITDRDICMAAYTQGRRLAEIRVHSAMSQRLLSCRPTDEAEQAEKVMQKHQLRRVPVVDGVGKLQGLLSLNDLARAAAPRRVAREGQVTLEEVGITLAAVCEPAGAERDSILQPGQRRTTEVPSSVRV